MHKYDIFHPESDAAKNISLSVRVLLVALTLIQGMTTCIKASIGGQLSHLLGRHRRATCYSFLSGGIVMCLLSSKDHLDIRRLQSPHHIWQLLASVFCTIYIVSVLFIFQRKLSAAATYCCLILGQLVSSTILDLTGWLNVSIRPFRVSNLLGLIIFTAGVVVATVGRHLQTSKRRPNERDDKVIELSDVAIQCVSLTSSSPSPRGLSPPPRKLVL